MTARWRAEMPHGGAWSRRSEITGALILLYDQTEFAAIVLRANAELDAAEKREEALRAELTRATESIAAIERIKYVLERGPRFTDRHMESAADFVIDEIKDAIAGDARSEGWRDVFKLPEVE